MTPNLLTNEMLSEKNVVSILVYLYVFGPKTRSEIYTQISTNPRMPKKLELLQNHGLIKNLDDVPGRKVITLTELGNKYASTLCNLEKMSGGSVEEFKWGVLKSMMDGAEKRAM